MIASVAPLRVGIIGAGPAVQTIHLPTLSRLPELFSIQRIMDVDVELASLVADQVGATTAASVDELILDPEVEVLAICSPARFHAEQMTAALGAGKRAILCEKPLATNSADARSLITAQRRSGVPIVVGTMHVFDKAWRLLHREHPGIADAVHVVRSSIVLPPNDRYESRAAEIVRSSRPAGTPAKLDDDALLSMSLHELAVHDIPLVRRLLPGWAGVEVDSAQFLRPFGSSVTGAVGDRRFHLFAHMHEHPHAEWTLTALGDDFSVHIAFTPSFVQAGSATATVSFDGGRSVTYGPFATSAYESEWRALHAMAHGEEDAMATAADAADDLEFTLALATGAARLDADEAVMR